jgi:AraC-like DNA-binding protein
MSDAATGEPMNESAPAKTLRFSTDSLPVGERLPTWRDAFGRSILKLEMLPIPGRPFRESGTFHRFDNLGIVVSETNGHSSLRTRTLLGECDDDLVFITILSGRSVASQLGRETIVPAGSAVLLTSAEVGRHHLPGHTRFMTLRIPRRFLSAFVADPEDRIARKMHENTDAVRLLRGYVQGALRRYELTSHQARQLFTTHVHDLAALALGATREATQVASGRGLRAARLDAIKADITARLYDEGLAVGDVARCQGVTPRYVQMLFEAEGTTFSQYLVLQRLTRAHRLLSAASSSDRTIADTAFAVGFGSLSHFNHVFRRHYGATPSEVRTDAGHSQDNEQPSLRMDATVR